MDIILSVPTGLCVLNRPVGRSESVHTNIYSVPTGQRVLFWPTDQPLAEVGTRVPPDLHLNRARPAARSYSVGPPGPAGPPVHVMHPNLRQGPLGPRERFPLVRIQTEQYRLLVFILWAVRQRWLPPPPSVVQVNCIP